MEEIKSKKSICTVEYHEHYGLKCLFKTYLSVCSRLHYRHSKQRLFVKSLVFRHESSVLISSVEMGN